MVEKKINKVIEKAAPTDENKIKIVTDEKAAEKGKAEKKKGKTITVSFEDAMDIARRLSENNYPYVKEESLTDNHITITASPNALRKVMGQSVVRRVLIGETDLCVDELQVKSALNTIEKDRFMVINPYVGDVYNVGSFFEYDPQKIQREIDQKPSIEEVKTFIKDNAVVLRKYNSLVGILYDGKYVFAPIQLVHSFDENLYPTYGQKDLMDIVKGTEEKKGMKGVSDEIIELQKALASKQDFPVIITYERNAKGQWITTFNQETSEGKQIPKELEPLAKEARKYKSAEEFVRGQGGKDYITVYHRTNEPLETFGKGGIYSKENKGEFFVSNKKNGQAEGYGKNVVELRVKKSDLEINDEFPSGEEHYTLPVKKADEYLKTKSRLIDFYNQAVKGIKPEVVSNEVQHLSLIHI